ncbi:MAG: GIY-YIG nuclease family protein [Candidatus Moraniibacteriota bacterium]
MEFFVYILKSLKDGRFHIGQTNDVASKIKRHNSGRVTATKNRRPLEVIHTEKFATGSEAMQREKYLKSLKSQKYILENIIKIT